MNEEQYDGLIESIDQLNKSVTDAVYSSNDAVADQLKHISGQMDIANHSLYTLTEFTRYNMISTMLLATIAMFLLGYMLTRR